MDVSLGPQDLCVLAQLRLDGRTTLAQLKAASGLQVSTVHSRLSGPLAPYIKRHTVLLDFEALGFSACALVLLKARRQDRDLLLQHVAAHPNTNTLHRTNNGFDLAVEMVFPRFRELDLFLEDLEERFRPKARTVLYLTAELAREGFLATLPAESASATGTAAKPPRRHGAVKAHDASSA